MNRVLFSSASCHWSTPATLYADLDAEFHFNDDPCPCGGNPQSTIEGAATAPDGLTRPWGSCTFVNPPYGREIGKWLAKAYTESQKDKTVVCLIPSRTDTGWWHEYVMKATEIRFIRGRLRFGGARHNAPFPSAIVIFRSAGR